MADLGVLVYHRTAERPDLKFWLEDDNGALIDFATGYTFEFKLGHLGQTAVFTKSSGIAGATGSGVAPDGVPNVTITFTSGELDAVPADTYDWQLRARVGGSADRFFQGTLHLLDVIT